MNRRVRLVVALALLTVAAAALWRTVARVRHVLVAAVDPRAGDVPPAARAALAAFGGEGGSATQTGDDTATGTPKVALVEVAAGFRQPLFAAAAPGDASGRLYVVEQGGRIRIVENGVARLRPFLDLSATLDTDSGERGLLGLAFAPDFERSGRFFVSYTVKKAVRVARFSRSREDPFVADPAGATLLEMADPASNHNGGMLAFGPDGFLYHGTGDGGSAGDPWHNAQNRDSLLGKMLRLDVSGERYAIPESNPFARGGGKGEIWLTGLRNPWRFAFDRATGDLWIGDVGQNAWEEIDFVPAGQGGGNFGWRTMEGFHCYDPKRGCASEGLSLPIHAYSHRDGCSVTGGYVYRGRALPGLVGAYVFGDYCNGRIWALRRLPNGRAEVSVLLESGLAISSFGEDAAGEILVCDHGGGTLRRLAPAP